MTIKNAHQVDHVRSINQANILEHHVNLHAIAENNPAFKSFIDVAPDSDFPIQNLPFCVFKTGEIMGGHIGSRIGQWILDLTRLEQEGYFQDTRVSGKNIFQHATLNPFMAEGKEACREVRARLSQLLRDENPQLRDHASLRKRVLIPVEQVHPVLPVDIGGFTDFYSSKEHATNLGRMFRGKDQPLMPNWLHLPVAYDGRSSSIVVSGNDVRRPMGQTKPDAEKPPVYGACKKLDFEIELGCFIGASSAQGEQIPVGAAPDHVFGMVLFNDWSARDIQSWEYQPLGPFLGKNFCSSISPWVVTLDALEPFRVAGPAQEPQPLPYLQHERLWNYDINLFVELQSGAMHQAQVISALNFKAMYWDFCQQLAHHTINGCKMRPGDLFASGTVSGKTRGECGSMIELSWGGAEPLRLSSGEERAFLEDGDRVTMKAYCQGDGYRIGFGEVTGTVIPALNAGQPASV